MALTYLDVPYAEKDKAKKLGAKWDTTVRRWYVPDGIDTEKFKPWLPANTTKPTVNPQAVRPKFSEPRLTVELVPKTCWYSNVRSEVSSSDWEKLKKITFQKANYRCEICSDRGSEWPVECHEIWHYDDKQYTQTLTGLIALCPNCHECKHMGLANVKGRGYIATAHLAKVNGWSMEQAMQYVKECFRVWEERSQHQWTLNISYLEQFGIQNTSDRNANTTTDINPIFLLSKQEAASLTKSDEIASFINSLTDHSILWLDTETADWWTCNPKLSLIQVLTDATDLTGKKVFILDVLHQPELVYLFCRQIMANANIEKVFHNSQYDLRFLGMEQHRNVTCTLKIARTMKKTLGVTNCQLKTLAEELCNFSNVNREEAKSDWGRRPLTPKQLDYARMDVVYLAQVHQRLLEIGRQKNNKHNNLSRQQPQQLSVNQTNYSANSKASNLVEHQDNKQQQSLPKSAHPPVFVLIDGDSLAFRSYFAFAKVRDAGLRTKTGIPTSVSFGFLKALLEVMGTQQPAAMAVAFDLGLLTFRHEADNTYKADRPDTPEDFIPDLENLHELLDGLNLQILTAPGYEADDILGTLAQRASAAGYRVKILTGDRDLFQLVDPEKEITVLYLSPESIKRANTGPTEFSTEQVKEKMGVLPSQIVDLKALCGDKLDNIPGVRGIGEKTAVKLLNEFGSLEQVYASLDKIKGANNKKLVEGKDDAEKSRYLAQIVLDIPLEVDLEKCKLREFDTNHLKPILEKLEFKSFLGKINELQEQFGGIV